MIKEWVNCFLKLSEEGREFHFRPERKPSDNAVENVLSENFDWMKYKSKQQAVEYIQCLSCSQRWNINEEYRSSGVGDTFIFCVPLDVRLSDEGML